MKIAVSGCDSATHQKKNKMWFGSGSGSMMTIIMIQRKNQKTTTTTPATIQYNDIKINCLSQQSIKIL